MPDYEKEAESFGLQGKDREAFEQYSQAERVYQAAGATKTFGYAFLLQSMGACFGNQGDYRKAMEHYNKAERAYEAAVRKETDPRGKSYYWIGGPPIASKSQSHTDCSLVTRGHATLTPLVTDVTAHALLDRVGRLV